MEQKSLWKKFFLLTVSSILALQLNVAKAQDTSPSGPRPTEENPEGCVLTEG